MAAEEVAQAVAEMAPGGFLLPHYRTFQSIINTFSRLYSHRYDEVIRKSRQDALAFKRDAYYQALIRERIGPLGKWNWEIAADEDEVAAAKGTNPKDPYSEEREQVRLALQAIVRRTPRFGRMRRGLGWGIWYGRQGVQWRVGQTMIAGALRKYTADYRPIMGDKILFDFDGTPGIMVQPYGNDLPKDGTYRYSDSTLPVLMLDRPDFRERVIIHTHDLDDADITEPIMAGRVHGIGVRDAIAWAAELRRNMMADIFDFMDKVGNLGLLLVYYEEGNATSKKNAEATAKNASGKSALAVPKPKGGDKQTGGVELIPANMTGVQFLLSLLRDWFEVHIERLIVGQSMSSGGRDTQSLGGTGRADFAKDTKWQLLAADAEDQQETLTEEWVVPLQRGNFPDAPFRYLFKYRLPDPEAADKLQAISTIAQMPGKKMEFKESEIRSLTGTTKPADGEDVVGGEEQQPGMVGMGGPQQQQGEGGDDLFEPGEFEALTGDQGQQVEYSGRQTINYSGNAQWIPHTLQRGPRKGQTVYENATTGEIRDQAPGERGQPSAEIPQSNGGGDSKELAQHVATIRAAGPKAVKAAKNATIAVWKTLKVWSTRLALNGLTYADALPDTQESTNPLSGSTAATGGHDWAASVTGIPSAQYLALKVVPAVTAYAVMKVKQYLAKKGKPEMKGDSKVNYSASSDQGGDIREQARKAITEAIQGSVQSAFADDIKREQAETENREKQAQEAKAKEQKRAETGKALDKRERELERQQDQEIRTAERKHDREIAQTQRQHERELAALERELVMAGKPEDEISKAIEHRQQEQERELDETEKKHAEAIKAIQDYYAGLSAKLAEERKQHEEESQKTE